MIKRGENMLKTNDIIKNELSNYSNKDTKLTREVSKCNLIKIVNGLYETNPNTPAYLLASSIYGPSYISFEYALSYYGLIPERVNVVTCATLNKKKKKKYNTFFGTFTYRDVPSLVYSESIILKSEDGYSYQIATKEKALCDKLYTLKPLKNYRELEIMLFNDLRMDKEEFSKLNIETIEKLSKLYHSTNVNLLAKYMKGGKYE